MRYYPLSRIITGSNTQGNQFTSEGQNYSGPYYKTFDGFYFSGKDPVTGDNKPLIPIVDNTAARNKSTYDVADDANANEYNKLKNVNTLDIYGFTIINPYYPKPTAEDYKRGYFIRYFAKKRNENGNLIEINLEVFNSLKRPDSIYNYQIFHAIDLYWQLTGPLKDNVNTTNGVRTAGIEDTNKRLTEMKGNNFKGLITFIGGNYSKFAKPTQ